MFICLIQIFSLYLHCKIKINMTLKKIKEHFRVRKMDGYYDLSTLEPQKTGRNVYKYICTIYKTSNQKFHLKGCEPVSKFGLLQEQIETYLDTLDYDSEYYCPSYAKGTSQDLFTFDLLNEYGFSRPWLSDTFVYNVKSIYNYNTTDIQLSYEVDVEKEVVVITLYCGDSGWVTFKPNFDLKNIHQTIDGFLKPLLLTEAYNTIKGSEKMGNHQVELVLNSIKGLSINSTKLELKTKLLELASAL